MSIGYIKKISNAVSFISDTVSYDIIKAIGRFTSCYDLMKELRKYAKIKA